MQLNPYLTFDGNGAEAMDYYAEILGGEVTAKTTFGDMPGDMDWVTDANRNRLAHGTVSFQGQNIMFSDTPGVDPHPGYAGVTLQMSVDDLAEGEALFAKLSQGGEVRMPFGPTFWAKGFGMCTDKYGVSWMVNHDAGPE